MTSANGTEVPEHLSLRSRISELPNVFFWVESLADRYAIPQNTRFAINLCLEEVLSNTIWYGYSAEPNHGITVRFAPLAGDRISFIVEDEARPFDPLSQAELPALTQSGEFHVGGQGLRLLRRFADALEYEQTATGNRLTMSFSVAQH